MKTNQMIQWQSREKIKNIKRSAAAAALAAFGALTLFLSAAIILDLFGIREKEGDYVLFVVIANLISALFYLGGAYGIIRKKRWTFNVLLIPFFILAAAFVALIIHIASGGLYETKTIGALIFRMTITLFFALYAYRLIKKTKQ